ncbi:hypothetical protein FHETE_9038 [Fusarium heterosporum]|uniref:Uncharacterized protein n=1 Tax=Fusarium heterosporum TaxID=42747 RepID=A0A8H5T0C7_FUSHE|nr:hypothetical protein FHETE_9038 [Fusarium heterosporum]
MLGVINSIWRAVWGSLDEPETLELPVSPKEQSLPPTSVPPVMPRQHRPAATKTTTASTATTHTQDAPPSFENPSPYPETASTWHVWMEFLSDRGQIQAIGDEIDIRTGWFAELNLDTPDIVSLMRNGLCVTENDVDISKNHTVLKICNRFMRRMYHRYYALNGTNYSGHLIVRAIDIKDTTNFRIKDLSCNKIVTAMVHGEGGRLVYLWSYLHTVRANNILDDTPLGGLWPWPKRE